MCLDYELTKKQADKIKEQARKRGYIRVWKVCSSYKLTGWMYGAKYINAIRKARCKNRMTGKKNVGWYAYLNKKSAQDCRDQGVIMTCYAKPEWIKRLGHNYYLKNYPVGIFTHLAFPDWDKGDMTIREFRAMCKEE